MICQITGDDDDDGGVALFFAGNVSLCLLFELTGFFTLQSEINRCCIAQQSRLLFQR